MLDEGITLGRSGKYDEAIECFDKAIQINPKYAEAWYNKGTALDFLGKHNKAIECFKKALSIDPDYADAWHNKGIALGKLGKYNEAIECFDKAIKINPDHAEAWYNRGIAFTLSGESSNAMKCYDRAYVLRDYLLDGGVMLHEVLSVLDESTLEIDYSDIIEMGPKVKKYPDLSHEDDLPLNENSQ